MTRQSPTRPLAGRLASAAEGFAALAILSVVTLTALVSIAVIVLHWQGVKLFLFGG